MSDTAYASGPPASPWIPLAIASVLLLLVWLVSPIWLLASLIVFSLLLFAYGGDANE